ncbi:MAG: serine hydrolase [Bacteroidia bacterium]|nr:serine hydrolase [Bacteroidia bacterium]
MKFINSFILFVLVSITLNAQSYFPPNSSSNWDSISPSSLDYCQANIDSLYDYLDANNTKAFILLKDGKIVLERYFNEHTDTSNWYWASAGKTIVALLTGIAQKDGLLDINNSTSTYLSEGWTNTTPEQESMISLRHQLTMTSGLDDGVEDPYCTLDTCLVYLAEAGTRWAYHNGPYTLLRNVIENASGLGINNYAFQKLTSPIGMNGVFVYDDYNSIFFSTARSMARFGLLMLNEGLWNQNDILGDDVYYNAMINTSQEHNESYGYLWWLNGKNSYMIPQTQYVFDGPLSPNAPSDMFAAMGKNGQYINVVPSENMVWIRMGNAPEETLVPLNFNDEIWTYINQLDCQTSNLNEYQGQTKKLVKISDVLGRPSKVLKNTPLFHIYDDGSVEQKIVVD